jgi:outer membrane immunogenic protein
MAPVKQLGMTSVAAALAMAVNLGAAQSADLDYAPSPSSLGYDWSGFYLGVAGGYFGAKTKNQSYLAVYDPDDSMLFDDEGSFKMKPSGGVFGGYAGYNWQVPGSGFVVGVEGDYNGVFGKKTKTLGSYSYTYVSNDQGDFVDMEGDVRLRRKVTSTWALRGRAGWAIESFMPYLAGGWAGASMKTTLSDTNPIGPGGRSKTHTYSGWTIGGGMDFLVTPNWTLGFDYQYKDLGKKTSRFLVEYPTDYDNGSVFNEADATIRTKLRANQFLVRGGYKF